MRRVFNRLRDDFYLGFDFVVAATACIVNAARCNRLRSDLRLDFNFFEAATACIVNAARLRPSSD